MFKYKMCPGKNTLHLLKTFRFIPDTLYNEENVKNSHNPLDQTRVIQSS